MMLIVLAGCSGGAVVFAPTPLPPDLSPLRYEHPSGAFAVSAPRNWSVYAQNTTTLALAAFSPSGSHDPLVSFAAINLGRRLDSTAFGEAINQYQQTRPDAGFYTQVERQAMGDGSWRITGLRHAGTQTRQINTFIQQTGTFIGVAEVLIPPDQARLAELEAIVNSFNINPGATLQAAELTTLAAANATGLEILHVSTWTTPGGVFFITGEVANYTPALVTDVPIRAALYTPDGLGVAEAVDTVMSYGIPPGGFAPFSLRFGGQPALSNRYDIILGNADWKPAGSRVVYGPDHLKWEDRSQAAADGRLVISGSVTNTSQQIINNVRAVVTVFDAAQNVIAAGFAAVTPSLKPGARAPFEVVVPERGGAAANYIVNVEGLP
jgi:hypothetical protein